MSSVGRTMNEAGNQPGRIIWEVGTDAPSRRWQRYVLPPAIALVVIGIIAAIATGDVGSGVFVIVFGLILVALVLVAPSLFQRARQNNPPVRSHDGALAWNDRSVEIATISTWSIAHRSSGGTPQNRVAYIEAAFQTTDGSREAFIFRSLTKADGQRLQAALIQALPTPPTQTLD